MTFPLALAPAILPELGPPGWIILGLIGLGVGGVALYNHMSSSSNSAADETDKANEKAKDLPAADTKGTCPECDEEKKKKEEQKAKDSKRMSTKELEKAAQNNGYDDIHQLKNDFGLDSKSDIFKDIDGNMYSGPRQGTGIPQPLGINVNGPGV